MDPSYAVLVGKRQGEAESDENAVKKESNSIPIAVIIAVPVAVIVGGVAIAAAIIYILPRVRVARSVQGGMKSIKKEKRDTELEELRL